MKNSLGVSLDMELGRKSLFALTVFFLNLFAVFASPAQSGDPLSAYYSQQNDRIFWLIQVTDIHIGTSGTQDSDNLRWIVEDAKNIIDPAFIVASGDLTDSTDGGNDLSVPDGPHQIEWDEYRSILDTAGMDAGFYYDMPGNHDAYNDKTFSYYLANSVQGLATGQTQVSWTREFSFGKYHFLGVNTAGNTGEPFQISFPYGDPAGLDESELTFINDRLAANQDADLTFIFGHHPLFDTGVFTDTWLLYGQQEFVGYMDSYGISLYGYGHTHELKRSVFSGNDYTGYMQGDGVYYFNTASLGKSSENQYSIIAVDCNGISTTTQKVDTWPVVLITAPLGMNFGQDVSPYAYGVPNLETNPLRALVFDKNVIESVNYEIDGSGDWYPMNIVSGNSRLYEALWDASSLGEGSHTIKVQANSPSGIGTSIIQIKTDPSIIYVSSSGSCGTKQPCLVSIQDAIFLAGPSSTILIAEGIYSEPITLNASKSLTLIGGWDTAFANQAGVTILRNAPGVQQGSITLQSLSIKPE